MDQDLLRRVWNWLPAFLEVAERGSAVRAAGHLFLTPAAVSRTVRLLEEEVGTQLFERVGRGLVLNEAGERLRDALRSARVDLDRGLADALADAGGDPYAGPLRVASLGVLTSELVVPGLLTLKRDHPTLRPEHQNLGTADALAALDRGELELVLHYEALDAPGRRVERLGETPTGVFCGEGHPLFNKRRVRREDVLAHAFSVPQIGDGGRVQDGWPTEVPRQVGMRITLLASNLDVCRSGLLLTVLPMLTASPHVHAGHLRQLPFELPSIEVFASTRADRRERPAARALVEHVRAQLAGAE